MTNPLNLENGHVVITGDAGGRAVTLEGNVKNVSLQVETDYGDVGDYLDSSRILKHDTRYFLEFDTSTNGTAYTLKVPTTTVTRTARVEAVDRTVEAYEKARKQAGAPKNAKMQVGDFMRSNGELVLENLDEPNPIMVEFRWIERVPS